MSPIVYVPSEPHECEPPRQGEWIPYDNGEDLYPDGTIWECDKCAERWGLRYELRMGRTRAEFRNGIVYYEVNWCRVYY